VTFRSSERPVGLIGEDMEMCWVVEIASLDGSLGTYAGHVEERFPLLVKNRSGVEYIHKPRRPTIIRVICAESKPPRNS
jgi:hypothetical protein